MVCRAFIDGIRARHAVSFSHRRAHGPENDERQGSSWTCGWLVPARFERHAQYAQSIECALSTLRNRSCQFVVCISISASIFSNEVSFEQVNHEAYGREMKAAFSAFRSDLQLVCKNATSFYRPTDRCFVMARRMMKFGLDTIEAVFPSSKLEDLDCFTSFSPADLSISDLLALRHVADASVRTYATSRTSPVSTLAAGGNWNDSSPFSVNEIVPRD